MSNADEISQIMANAKKQIEEKKAKLGLNKQEDRLAAINALKAKIAASQVGLNSQIVQAASAVQQIKEKQQTEAETIEQRQRSLNTIIDSEGRAIDKRTGEIIQIESRVPTLKANLKVAQKRDYKTMSNGQQNVNESGIMSSFSGIGSVISGGIKTAIPNASTNIAKAEPLNSTQDIESQPFFDNRLAIKTAERSKRKLIFNDKGKYQDIGNKLRNQAKLTKLQQEIAVISKKTGISAESRLALIQPKRALKENIPNIEWWDFAVLNEPNYDSLEQIDNDQLREKLKITALIEHPVQMKPPTQTDTKVIPTVMLTSKERKKIRRQNRSEALKEEQEKIRLGLVPPPEPKGKINKFE
jgi:U4/U6 small nuclear ribonucleoprotein PRP3